ncbi:MAG TPA: GNAT family protein [Gryllotalpicola sp.]
MPLFAPVLGNSVVRLEPLTVVHADAMRAAVAEVPRDSFGYTRVPTPGTVEEYIAERLADAAGGAHVPFAQFDAASDRLLGHTSYLNARFWPDGRVLAVEVGHTWLVPSAQGRAVNSASKLLLFGYAFETLGVARVDLKSDARNARSRAGIAAVGARFEGVLRSWQPSSAPGEDGLTRDTAMFSITAAEWPDTRTALEERLAAKLG